MFEYQFSFKITDAPIYDIRMRRHQLKLGYSIDHSKSILYVEDYISSIERDRNIDMMGIPDNCVNQQWPVVVVSIGQL